MSRETLPLRFDVAIRNKNVPRACELARKFPNGLMLYHALELTILFGRVNDHRFEAAARRFLARYAHEGEPTLREIAHAATAFDKLNHAGALPALSDGADLWLDELAEKLRRG